MQGFLDIFLQVVNWLDSLYIPLDVGSFHAQLSLWEFMIGVLICNIGIYFLFKVFDY